MEVKLNLLILDHSLQKQIILKNKLYKLHRAVSIHILR